MLAEQYRLMQKFILCTEIYMFLKPANSDMINAGFKEKIKNVPWKISYTEETGKTGEDTFWKASE